MASNTEETVIVTSTAPQSNIIINVTDVSNLDAIVTKDPGDVTATATTESIRSTKEASTVYLSKRKVEVDLTNIPDISTLNIVEDEYGSMTSQYTDDLSSVGDYEVGDYDDDDGSINNEVVNLVNSEQQDNMDYVNEKTDGKVKEV